MRLRVGISGVALLLTGLVVAPALPRAADYPTQDIHFICAFPPGSGADVIVRYFADKVRPLTGRNVIVENRSGAGGNIAIEYVARAKPDGYTVFVHGATGTAASMSLFKKPPVDVGKTIQVVATINRQPFMILVDAKSPYQTLADLTAAMKQKGAKASYATAAPFGTVVGEIYKQGTGVTAVEVPYKNAIDSLNDQLSGSLDYAVHDPVYALAEQRKGDLRILAVSTADRLKANPDFPTMKELGITDLDLMGWWAAMVPQGTPKPIADQINKWFDQVVATEETRKFLASFGGDQLTLPQDKAQELFLKDINNWADYVRIAKIVPSG
ncbi:MAG: tripartite tricarboxylate transporter substrate binding protein [Xanthobacteraceae bacterium]|nr:tripartite tricarboxylate transporter substrate binding protein [Xanthobacteraceae bacterium]